ncbi:MAG: hypothetical protein EOS27_14325 [Mesorhizobium sp.]|nr:MAG: hypothetical protein EOS27_14325 [Mesorhizobium sp.]TIX28171.1 MAG: hypothetical protein E5V35_03230 [Mesorhizobium sp.]
MCGSRLSGVVQGLRGIVNFRGAVVTMPHKRDMLALLDEMMVENNCVTAAQGRRYHEWLLALARLWKLRRSGWSPGVPPACARRAPHGLRWARRTNIAARRRLPVREAR